MKRTREGNRKTAEREKPETKELKSIKRKITSITNTQAFDVPEK